MEVGTIVSRKKEWVDTTGEIIEIVGDRATVKWKWSGVKTKVKLTSLQPYVERTEKEKILDQIEKNKRQMNRRGCSAGLISWLKKDIAMLQAKVEAI